MKREREDLRKEFIQAAEKMFDSMLPEDGSYPDTTINEIEDRVISDGKELERKLVETRLELEGQTTKGDRPECPRCGKKMRIVESDVMRKVETTIGGVDYGRGYCSCDRCEVAFSPNGRQIRS